MTKNAYWSCYLKPNMHPPILKESIKSDVLYWYFKILKSAY